MAKKPEKGKAGKSGKGKELSSKDLEKVSGGMRPRGQQDTSNTALQADVTPDKGDGVDRS